jgi:hypothetical protein
MSSKTKLKLIIAGVCALALLIVSMFLFTVVTVKGNEIGENKVYKLTPAHYIYEKGISCINIGQMKKQHF